MYPTEEIDPFMVEDPAGPKLLKKAGAKVKKSAGDALTDTTQSVLPNAIETYRSRAADAYKQGLELYNREPDMGDLQSFARQRSQQGESSMLNALAAQYAGENFQPVQAQFLKKAAAAQEPMKAGSGFITADGKYIKDPQANQDKKAEFLLQQAKAYEQMATNAQTAQEAAEARRAQKEIENQLRMMGLNIQGMNAQTARLNATGGGGGFGAGTASQIGSGPANEPIFRQKDGRLFTYDASGQATPYAGPVNPKVSTAQPTEDERKAAGWFAQANNAMRNVQGVLLRNGQASMPQLSERLAGFVPGVGEDIANNLRNEDRQQFVQAAGSFAEAALRAATGAGVNLDEARQKVAELTPQLGDKPGNIKQKMDAWQVYMDSLKTRAGRALPSNAPGAAPADDPLGIRGR